MIRFTAASTDWAHFHTDEDSAALFHQAMRAVMRPPDDWCRLMSALSY